jgi:hypothetical protein
MTGGRQMNSRIPVNGAVHAILRDYAKGLDMNMNDALLYLLCEKIEAGDDALLKGRSDRADGRTKRVKMKNLEDSTEK